MGVRSTIKQSRTEPKGVVGQERKQYEIAEAELI